jgi:hypothetical protein
MRWSRASVENTPMPSISIARQRALLSCLVLACAAGCSAATAGTGNRESDAPAATTDEGGDGDGDSDGDRDGDGDGDGGGDGGGDGDGDGDGPLHAPTPVQPVQPGDDWHAASDAAYGALAGMYNPHTGQFTSGWRWSWASGAEIGLTAYARSSGALVPYLFAGTYDLNDANYFIDDWGYDDQAWWANAWVRAYDETGELHYLDMARFIFSDMVNAWDDGACGGGVVWDRTRAYRNAITSELFILLAANLHNRTGEPVYLDWAKYVWAWFQGSGMINAQNLVNDGLTPSCANNGQTTWTYNQGVILAALVELYQATSDRSYLEVAERIADAATTLLVDAQGVLREPCEQAGICNDDQSTFKGIFQRYLMRLYEVTGKPAYGAFLLKNARAVWRNARGPNDALGISWSGPFDRADAQRQISAMHALATLAAPYSVASRFVRAAGGASFNHAMGHPASPLGWACDRGSCPAAGLMQAGPFLASLPAGPHVLHAQLSVSRTSAESVPLVDLEVYASGQARVIAKRTVLWSELGSVGARHDFTVPFVHDASQGELEFRVRWLGAAATPELVVGDLSIGDATSLSAANLEHGCGRLDPHELWVTDRHDGSGDCLVLSGGQLAVAAGPALARFELAVDDFWRDDAPVAVLAVVDHADGRELATRTLTRGSFANTLLHRFDLPFAAVPGHAYDFTLKRIAATHAPTLRARAVHVVPAPSYTPVALPFNTVGIREAAGQGSLDSVGSSLAAQAFTRPLYAGLHEFSLGSLSGAAPNLVSTAGQTLTLPAARGQALELLVFAVHGAQAGEFRVAYSDGSSQVFTRTISDWAATTLAPGEEYAVAAPYRWVPTGAEYGNFHVFMHSLPLDATKTLASLGLPDNAYIKLVAATVVSRAP